MRGQKIEKIVKEPCDLKVFLRTGASIVKVKPIFTSDSKNIIVCSGLVLKVFRIQSGECLQILKHHKKTIIGLQKYMGNPLQVYSCSKDGMVVRWDYSEGTVLEVIELRRSAVAFYAPSPTGPFYITKQNGQGGYMLLSVMWESKITAVKVVLEQVLPDENTVAFGFDGNCLASVCGYKLTTYDLETEKSTRYLNGMWEFKCIAMHPSKLVLATGDYLGRVIIWSEAFKKRKPIRSVYHWHQLSVADLIFSTEGSYLYSGGGEATLVKWNLTNGFRNYLPRLGSPIRRLNISPDNYYVVTAHDDNGLQVISPQRYVDRVIQGLSKGHFQGSEDQDALPVGILFDPRSRAIVMNGRIGHLQFYNIQEDKQLFNLDITCKNYITQERDRKIWNIDVQKAAIDETGSWLATVEYWDDGQTSPQIWLKFFYFDVAKQKFVLNTNVILPHDKKINCIVFRPCFDGDTSLEPLAVTTSSDTKFKVWSSREDKVDSWDCEFVGCYRDFPAGNACFSEEGSLLAVAFDDVATLWTVDKISLKSVLCHDKSKGNIKYDFLLL